MVDLDNKRSVDLGNGELIGEGIHSIRQQELTLGDLPETLTSQTGSGGMHLIFQYPTSSQLQDLTQRGVGLGNRAGVWSSVDIRGDGGYIIVPPSLHQSGNRYRWIESDLSPAQITDPWIHILTTQTLGENALALDIEPGFEIPEGQGRHQWLHKMGSKLRGQHGLPYMALFGALSAYNYQVCRPPLNAAEVEHIVKSCMKYEPGMPVPEVEVSVLEIEEGIDVAISFSDFMEDEPEAFVPLIEKMLNNKEVMIIGGQPNIGKTWVVMDMMLGIANGSEFAGHFRCEKGPVLFIDEEGSKRGNWERFKMLLSHRDRSALEFPLYSKVGAGIKIDSDRGRAAISRLIERYRPRVVFMDSLVRLHGGDESNNRAMANFFEQVTRLKENYGTAFVFTHHIRKPPKDGDSDPTWVLRGAGDIQGYPDTILVAQPGLDSTEINVYHTKMRNGEKLEPFVLSLRVDDGAGLATVGYLGPIHKSIGSSGRIQILNYIRRRVNATEQEIAGATGLSIKTTHDHIVALQGAGEIHAVTDASGSVWWGIGRGDGSPGWNSGPHGLDSGDDSLT